MKRSAEPTLYLSKGGPKLNAIEVERNGEIVKRDRFQLPRNNAIPK